MVCKSVSVYIKKRSRDFGWICLRCALECSLSHVLYHMWIHPALGRAAGSLLWAERHDSLAVYQTRSPLHMANIKPSQCEQLQEGSLNLPPNCLFEWLIPLTWRSWGSVFHFMQQSPELAFMLLSGRCSADSSAGACCRPTPSSKANPLYYLRLCFIHTVFR